VVVVVLVATTPVCAEVADAEPAAFVAVTTIRSVLPASADTSVYVLLVAPLMLAHEAPALSQRRHWYAYDVGAPLQLPVEAVSVWPTTVLPLIVGSAVFVGGATTAGVGLEVATDEPLLLEAVTLTRRAWPTSPDTGTYDALRAPVSDEQPLPEPSHRSH
jgi:hypothetical protein